MGRQNPSIGVMMPSKEVVSVTRAQAENLTVFFGCFLMVHLAPDADMDGYLGFTPPEAWHSPKLPLTPKWASISCDVFRKCLKKSVRFSSTSLLMSCRLRHKRAFYKDIPDMLW